MIEQDFWRALGRCISAKIDTDFSVINIDPVSGGDINQCYSVSDHEKRFFIKVNQDSCEAMFEQEAYSLAAIKKTNKIECPNVITTGVLDGNAFLALEFIALNNTNVCDWHLFGQRLAQMHDESIHGQFGWQYDNFIGLTPQSNQWQSNWRSFFAEQRIGWQLQLLHEKSITFGNVDFIVEACHKGLLNHKVSPALVHGDLWQGNLGFSHGAPAIFDPACYYGDREVDLAMTELFGTLPQSFYQGYQSIFNIPPGYEKRKHIYNLYHILNHANLFGDAYIDQAKATISRVLAFD